MRDHFPDAMVEDYVALIPSMTNDEKDRHVLAAAVRANAEVIVTANTKDFPRTSTSPYEIEVLTPDDFLLDQLDLHPQEVLEITERIVADMRHPSLTWTEYTDLLHDKVTLPLFASELRRRR